MVERRLLDPCAVGSNPTRSSKELIVALNKDVKLDNVLEKDGEVRFIFVRAGVYFCLTKQNIPQMRELLDMLESNEQTYEDQK